MESGIWNVDGDCLVSFITTENDTDRRMDYLDL